MKYTKGEWVVSKSGHPDFSICVKTTKDGGSVCHVSGWSESMQNAKLIAAAPDLLENLIKCADALHYHSFSDHPAVLEAKEAIKKATD